ncbi:hypothetical protein SNOG_11863 [Parastagonospora nodorum SN15]|uniref:Uncharacterized protein n=1 Tax=Phaeosphaeria nodorum (strain SN15 / ATCC MYA-4574 / FGSC 10173) TaxID=321614 RepID=Q0U8Q1_PHANO|nr:hypothetical protein SNOG_11863 [Parastagonospora nodorum SN15]EAT80907.1 hypothetical protein SNOG_11863 [Parastagonospora nodorum SN15]
MRVVGQRLFEANSAGSASSEQFTLALQSGRQARRGDDCSGGSHWRLRLIATLHETRGTEHLRAFACHPPTPRVRQRSAVPAPPATTASTWSPIRIFLFRATFPGIGASPAQSLLV